MIVKIEFDELIENKEQASYYLEHKTNGRANNYKVVCRIAGLQGGNIWLEPSYYEVLNESNEETLIESAVFVLFEDNIN